MFDVDAYLRRIGWTGRRPGVDADSLCALQFLHLTHVPYENFDIIAGRPFSLNADDLYDKIVERRRGGFCYEMNILFHRLLVELGFKATILASRILHIEGMGPDCDHMILLVELEQRWIADAGNSRFARYPLALDAPGEQTEGNCTFWFKQEGGEYALWQRDSAGEEALQYAFTLQPRRAEEFIPICQYKWTSPESRFTKTRLCSMVTPEGRMAINGMRLITTVRGERTDRDLDEEEYRALLRDFYGLAEL